MKPFNFPQACSVQEKRSAQPTRKLVVKGALEVEFRRGDRPALIVAGETADAVAAVKTTYKGDKLVIEREERVMVSVGNIVMTFNGSSGTVVAADPVTGRPTRLTVPPRPARVVVGVVLPELPAVKLKGSGDVALCGLRQPELALDVVGSGEVVAEGQVDHLAIRVAGSGDVDVRKLTTAHADLSVTGSGEIQACVHHDVRARVAGSGEITVGGDPLLRDPRVTGSGDIRFR
ncbi:GIN domain-containing protein [Burkholderia sp. AW33-5]